jgi:hypothetical protein
MEPEDRNNVPGPSQDISCVYRLRQELRGHDTGTWSDSSQAESANYRKTAAANTSACAQSDYLLVHKDGEQGHCLRGLDLHNISRNASRLRHDRRTADPRLLLRLVSEGSLFASIRKSADRSANGAERPVPDPCGPTMLMSSRRVSAREEFEADGCVVSASVKMRAAQAGNPCMVHSQ